MRWSIPFLRLFGIPVRIHLTFFLLLSLVYYIHQKDNTPIAGWTAVLMVCALFLCVLAHELGHSLMARYFGTKTRGIVLLPIGGVALLEQIPKDPIKEIIVAIAGPLVSILLVGLFFGISLILGVELQYDITHLSASTFLGTLILVNIWIICLNFLPAFPMDGGRIFRGILSMLLGPATGTVIAVRCGQFLAIGFVVLGLYKTELSMLMIIGVFIFIGAGQEGRITQIRLSLTGTVVSQAMQRTFQTVTPAHSLAEALNRMVEHGQNDLPVIQDQDFIGIATEEAVLSGIRALGPDGLVSMIGLTRFPTVAPMSDLEKLSTQLMRLGGKTIPVLDQGVLVGLISWEQVSRFARLQAYLKKHAVVDAQPMAS